MDQYVGVSLKQTWISVRQNRKRIWRGKCYPRAVAEAIRQHAPNAVLVVFETLATWFHHDLTACQRCASTHGMRRRRSTRRRTTRTTPVVARRGREVRVKSWAAMQVRTLVRPAHRHLERSLQPDPHEDVRPGRSGGRRPDLRVRALLEGQAALAGSILPLLEAWRAVRAQATALDRQLVAVARQNPACRLLMTVPGIGAVTALSDTTMIENPANFGNSRAVGAFSRRGATNRARSTTTGTSRDAATSPCAPCSTRPRR
jgi:transposase